MQRILQILGVSLSVFMAVPAAQAQVQLPEFSISSIPTLENNFQEAFDYERAFSSVKNPMMADTLRLQYQINLLERLIRRQTEIQRIAESYQNVGLPFRQPAPPESACSTLPVNILCMAFYPESAKYKDLIDERREEARRDQERQMQALLQQYNIAPQQPRTNTGGGESVSTGDTASTGWQQQRPSVSNPDYIWSDIRCLSGNCSALLESLDDDTLRFRIRSGDELPDGSKVTKISAMGVVVVKEDSDFDLRPKGVTATAGNTNESAVADILRQQFGSVPSSDNNPAAAAPSPVSNEDTAAIPPQGVPNLGLPSLPLLGPTGLF